MKKLFLFFAGISFIGNIVAQIPVANQSQISNFYKSTTLVVKDNSLMSSFNLAMEEAMEKYWTATPYKFISPTELDKYQKDNQYSFIMKARIRYDANLAKDVEYNFLTLVLGDRYAESITLMPDLCSFPLSYDKADADSYLYKIGAILLFMQAHVKNTQENPDLSGENIVKFYNKNATEFNKKTLYIEKKDLSPDINSLSKVQKIYPGKVKLATPEEIQKAIDEKNPDVVFLHKVGPTKNSSIARCWKMILGAEDANLYYFDHHKITKKNPDGLLDSDLKKFKKMNK